MTIKQSDIKKTQHYSTNEILLNGLADFVPPEVYIIEPFFGKGDLVKNFQVKEYYDIDFSKDSPHYRDTLKNPPDYCNKWVITNPPYLARNKATNKEYYTKELDDLYKVAISTMLLADGGILIIPINFFADKRSKHIRTKFLDTFNILRLNIFMSGVFEKTNYNVCSFVFNRKQQITEILNIPTFIYDNNFKEQKTILSIQKQYDYRIGGDFFNLLDNTKSVFGRITEKKRDNASFIKIQAIDKTNENINFYYDENIYYGKESDRNLASFSCSIDLSREQQIKIIKKSNEILQNFRKQTYNLCLTNYRDRNRKRLGFEEAEKILSLAYSQLFKEEC